MKLSFDVHITEKVGEEICTSVVQEILTNNDIQKIIEERLEKDMATVVHTIKFTGVILDQ